ncbi:MAG: Uma2 family endonuclease [Thermomicrobiales bacterium]
MATTTATRPTEQQIVLHDVSWETYERLLIDHTDRSVPHFTYDRGKLEILAPSPEHEIIDRTLALLVELVAAEVLVDVINVGSMTFKRRDLERGFEPDSSFYIQNEERVRGLTQIDPAINPPPDLIIEIEITRSAIPKLPIYASMGVPEVWRWDGERVTILQLGDNGYVEVEVSAALPPLTSEILTRFLVASQTLRRTVWIRQVRDWARALGSS